MMNRAKMEKSQPQNYEQETLDNECLLDGFLVLYEECTHDSLLKIKHVSSFVKKYNKAVSVAKADRMKVSDFEVKAVIGRGHFGEVRVVSEHSTGDIYAMKVLRKAELLSQPEISFYEEERDIMADANSDWITKLHYAFQDSVNLYLVMDFHVGGDLLSLLGRHDDIFDEQMAKFYIAEIALAINSLHEMGYIHRDIKPENLLLDYRGHIKLADFGSAARLDASGKVSAQIPVGTPDYIAPELLQAMNKSLSHFSYGAEVDWWSLGVCAFEMLFGGMPFTDDTSKISTYANIMDYKRSLKFPVDSDVSTEARDFIKKLLTNSQDRLRWQDIQAHPFFSGISWDTIRKGDACYVPSISGLDDTSHFNEVETVRQQPNIAALKPQRDFSGRDLPFIGFTFNKLQKTKATDLQCVSSKTNCNNSSHVPDTDSTSPGAPPAALSSHALQLLSEKDEQIRHLKHLLEVERKNWNEVETNSVTLLNNLSSMNSEIRSFEDELLEVKLEEMKGEIILLEIELEKLSSQLRGKEQELSKANAALEETSHQLQLQQMKLDRERRKSRDDQRKDLMLLELRSETWESLLEEKQALITELNNRVRELEELVEAYEDSEERQATEVDQLEHKINNSLSELSSTFKTDVVVSGGTGQAKVELDSCHHRLCPSSKKLTLHVTLRAGRCSFLDNNTLTKLQELQKIVDVYAKRAHDWQKREEELTLKISNLESDNHVLQQREGMGRKMKDSLMDNVTSYQQEVQTQKAVIKELQETMRTYLRRSSAFSDTEKHLKELQQSKLGLEAELLALREDNERTRQTALNKTSQMEEAVRKLEEQRSLAEDFKKRYDCHMETTEEKIRSLEEELAKQSSDRQRLERREAALTAQVDTLQSLLDDRNAEMEKLERRNTDIQSHLQQLQQRNTDLQVQVESLQKSSAANNEQKQSVAELNFQINRLQQQNTELEHRNTSTFRDKQSLDDRIVLLEREKERLLRRIKRLEAAEQDRHGLETKVEKMVALERDNRRLELKLERLSGLEKDKLSLEEKLDKLQLDLRKEKITSESLVADKKSLEMKLADVQSKVVTDNSEDIAQLKMKVVLMEAVEKERCALEEELKVVKKEKEEGDACRLELEKLRAEIQQTETEKKNLQKQKELIEKENETEKKNLQKQKELIEKENETEKKNLRKQKEILEKEKQLAEEKQHSAEVRLAELMKEKAASDDQMAMLIKEVDRLGSKLGVLEDRRNVPDVNKLSFEIDRLKKLVDKLEQNQTTDVERKRNSADMKSGLVDKLQREKADLQKQVERLEKEASKNVSGRAGRSFLTVQQEGPSSRLLKQQNDETVKKLEQELANLRVQLKEAQADSHMGNKNKSQVEELEKLNKDKVEKISSLTSELSDKKEEIAELQSKLETQTLSLSELRVEIEELLKTENALLDQLEKEALNAKNAHEEKEKLAAQLKEKLAAVADCPGNDSDLAVKVKELELQLEESKREMEIRKAASEFSAGDIPAYLRHELNESNLALSEARSLLAASKRQEIELRDRIDRQQRILDNRTVDNARCIQNSHDAIAELKSLQSQHDTLQRQYKVLEEKYAGLQKERGSSSSETVRLSEEIARKQQLYEFEHKKAEQLMKVCRELEEQTRDLELVVDKFQEREHEWENIRKSYEQAVNEREELQGAARARCEDSETITSMKHQMESIKALHKADVEKLNHILRDEMSKVKKLSSKVAQLEEQDRSSVEVYESQMREMDKLNKEVMRLKEELTQSLSDNSSLRKQSAQLNKHLQEAMDKFELISGEKVNLENFAETLQGLHFLDKYKCESTIGQQMKLIDYLQDLYMEHTGKKKSKLFGMKGTGKDGTLRSNSATLSWSDLQSSLEQERSKNHRLQEQVTKLENDNSQLSNELLKWKQSNQESSSAGKIDRVQANLLLKVTHPVTKSSTPSKHRQEMTAASSMSSLASVASSSSSSSSHSDSAFSGSRHSYRRDPVPGGKTSWRSMDSLTPQRMHHNIPHRFATGLNTRATKCGLCLGSVHFVRQASKCQECGLVVHPKCASSVPATCGLPTEYVRHFALMMNRIYREGRERESDIDSSAVKMEGWLKVQRVGKPGWENRYCVLEGTWLSLYLSDDDANPVDSFDLNPMDADVSVHSAVTSSELANTATSDLYHILRLDQDPMTTCWPGRYLYLMATNFQEKQRWVASLEAVVKSVQCKNHLYHNKSQMLTILSLKDGDQREFNCSLVISPQLVLLGTEDGLYAMNPEALTSKYSRLIQLTGFGSVHQMALAKGVDLILILTGPERRLVMLENKLVKCRMSQTLGGETVPFSFRMVEGLQSCTVFDVGLWNHASYLCVGTPTKLYLMKYNPNLAMYCVRKEFPSSEPCSCVCIAENYAIVGTERFYKINLEHPSLLDFVDRQDSSLAFAAFSAANHSSFPLAVVRTSPDNASLEFLLCFHEFGVFVDHRGQRSRATDVKWSGLPLAFAFVDPFLYVTYTNTVQATVVPTDRSLAKGRQTILDIQSPRYLGPAPSYGSVYISSPDTSNNVTEVIRVRGQEDFSKDYSLDKENVDSSKIATNHQVRFTSPSKNPKVNQLRRQGSLTSVTSNSSGSTYASLESGV